MESVGKTIVSVFRKEWSDEEEQPTSISAGAIRNERSKVNKQIKDNQLDWKYVNGLIEFAVATYDHGTIVKRLGDMRTKYRVCKKQLKELEESIDDKVQQRVDEKIEEDYHEKLKEKVECEKQSKVEELEDRIQSQSNLIKKLMEKSETQYKQIEGLKKRPSREAYDDLESRFSEYINATKLKKSESTTSLSSNDDDSKYKKKYKKLKEKCDKLELENFKLKQKINNKDDSDSDSDTSSDEEVITEKI